MKILVTGGAGFVGSHVCEYYAQKNHEVIAIDNKSRGKLLSKDLDLNYNWNYLQNKYDNVELKLVDIRNFETLKHLANDVEVIIHTAAQTAVTTSLVDPRTDFEVNALGTFNVLEAARQSKSNPCVVYCSTNKVYGDNVNKIQVKESETRYEFADGRYSKGIPENFPTDHCEHTPYGASKYSADIYCQDYAYRNEVDTAVFRMSCIYGTRQLGVEDQGWVAWFISAIISKKPITIFGNGKQVRDVLYVEDLVRAYDAFLENRDKIKHCVYNVGGGEKNTMSLLELINLIENETGLQSDISFAEWRPSDQKVYISDISKIHDELKWYPKISPIIGVKKFIDWYNEYAKVL
jgi:CDP-paratose 2-epimerase